MQKPHWRNRFVNAWFINNRWDTVSDNINSSQYYIYSGFDEKSKYTLYLVHICGNTGEQKLYKIKCVHFFRKVIILVYVAQ